MKTRWVAVAVMFEFSACLGLLVMYLLTLYRRAPDGTMSFCRSMGTPGNNGDVNVDVD